MACTLGVARTDADGTWRFLGLLPLADPPRTDAAATIAQARRHVLTVKMVTGDNIAIGRQIASEIGLRGQHPRRGQADHRRRRRRARRGGAPPDRAGRRLRRSVPRAQIRHRQGAAGRGPRGRHDRRRGERRAGAEAGRGRHRRLRRHRRGVGGGACSSGRSRRPCCWARSWPPRSSPRRSSGWACSLPACRGCMSAWCGPIAWSGC